MSILFQKNNFYKNFDLLYIFTLSKENVGLLERLTYSYLNNPNSSGLVINVDKNSFELGDLTFLKNIIINFYLKKKIIGVWGIPYCVLQIILGGFDYTRLSKYLIDENSLFDISRKNFEKSVLLLNCKECIKKNNCCGVGHLTSNLNQFSWRASNNYRLKVKNIVKFNPNVKHDYLKFISHISKFSLNTTDRTITYARIFNNSNSFNYLDRFIYFCNYLDLVEFKREFEFIYNFSKSKEFVNFFLSKYIYFFQRFAYSLAYGKKLRETFYGFFQDENKSMLFLDKLNLNFNKFKFENFIHSIGFDLFNDKIDGYKTYSYVNNKEDFFKYVSEDFNFNFSNDILSNSYNYLFVRRFSSGGELISIKIELYFYDFDKIKKSIKSNFNINISRQFSLAPKILAFDISKLGKVNKITLYSWFEP